MGGEDRYVRYSVTPQERYSRLIVDRVDSADRSRRIRERDQAGVDALVLHQTSFSRGNSVASYDRVAAHFVILPNGTIVRLHENWFYLHSSNGFNARSVAVEFVGNFPNGEGNWWRNASGQEHHLATEQATAGRHLISYLRESLRITHVFAHRQANRRHGNCCGPEIWSSVGQWALGRGLSDGGPGYVIPGGAPIPDAWRESSHNVLQRAG